MHWDQYFMSMTLLVAMKSKDKSTHIGAVIVGPDHEIVSTGFNGLPRGMDDTLDVEKRNSRPYKYMVYEHGERNALYNAARIGVSTKGCKLYTNGFPCADCARAIIQSGVVEVVTLAAWDNTETRAKWVEHSEVSRMMFTESGVAHSAYSGELISQIKIFRDGVYTDLDLLDKRPSQKCRLCDGAGRLYPGGLEMCDECGGTGVSIKM